MTRPIISREVADKPPIPCKSAVPLDEQRAALRAGGEKALLKLRDDLSRRSYREHILGMADDRLVTIGFPQYGDAACHLSRDEAQHEADCEISDYPVYICLGGMANDPR